MIRLCLFICALLWAGHAAADRLVVFAAASLKGPLDQALADYPQVVVSYGGSGAIARQVAQGAPADLVFLAHPRWLDWLDTGGHLRRDSRRAVLGNRLVIVARDPTPLTLTAAGLQARLGAGRLGIGLSSVPAGIYAQEALHDLGLWETVSNALAPAENVRAVLALVARGAVPLGIVYATDVALVPDLSVVADIPPRHHSPIRYELAVTSGAGPGAADLAAGLAGATAARVFEAAGFTALSAP